METSAQKPKSNKRPFNVTVAGTNRGARANLGAFERLNQRLTSTELALTTVDPVAGRAELVATEARARRLEAEPIEGAVEDVLEARPAQPLVLHLDRPKAICDTLTLVEQRPVPVLGLLLIALPSERLLGVRFTLRANDTEARSQVRIFFERLAAFAARSGSDRVIGVDAPVGHQLSESLYREWFTKHTDRELGRLIARVEPEAFPLEATLDGTTTLPMLVISRDHFGEPMPVVLQALRDSATPVPRNTDVLVAEITPTAMRLHEARRRASDGRVSLGRSDLLTPELLQTADEVTALQYVPEWRSSTIPTTTAEAAQVVPSFESTNTSLPPLVLLIAALATVSAAQPVFTTD